MKITYFLDIFSSWCSYAEPVWAELKKRHAGRATFEWKIALMNREDFPSSREQCDWVYQRSGVIMRTPFRLDSGWWDAERKGDYTAAALVAEAGRALGVPGDELRLALTHAALREGRRVGDLDAAVAVGAQATGIDAAKLREAALSEEVARRVRESTAAFHALQIAQRPAFLLEDAIGDRAVFSGLVGIAPLAVTIDAMLSDEAAYQNYAIHFGRPPV